MSLKLEQDLNSISKNQYSRAKEATLSKNYDYAINLIQAALKEEPLFLDGRRNLRAIEINKYKSLSSFQKQMVGMKVASSAMKLSNVSKKDPAEQLAIAEEVLAHDPFHPKANATIGDAGEALGYLAFKAFAYETLAAGKPTDKPDKAILNKLAQTYMELHEPDKAQKTFQRILDFDPKDGDALSGMKDAIAADAHSRGGWGKEGDYRNQLKSKEDSEEREQQSKIVKSLEAIDEQIALNQAKHEADPANPALSKAIAQLYVQKNDYASAVLYYEHSFNAGGRVDSSLEKIIGDLKLKHADQELMALTAAHAEQTDPEAQAQYVAAIEQKKKEIDFVRLEQAEAFVRAYPNDGQYRFDLGEALFKVGEYKRALTELQQSLKQPSVRYLALNLMGLCFKNQGMYDLAIKRFSEAQSEMLGMDELKKEITYNLGTAYEASGKADLALEQFKKIYEVDMVYRDVANRVEASYNQTA